jgi:hypothetical protein
MRIMTVAFALGTTLALCSPEALLPQPGRRQESFKNHGGFSSSGPS